MRAHCASPAVLHSRQTQEPGGVSPFNCSPFLSGKRLWSALNQAWEGLKGAEPQRKKREGSPACKSAGGSRGAPGGGAAAGPALEGGEREPQQSPPPVPAKRSAHRLLPVILGHKAGEARKPRFMTQRDPFDAQSAKGLRSQRAAEQPETGTFHPSSVPHSRALTGSLPPVRHMTRPASRGCCRGSDRAGTAYPQHPMQPCSGPRHASNT